jgi:HSP20 family protein
MNTIAQPETIPQTTDAREYLSPKVNIVARPDGYVVTADFPGVNKEGLEVSVDQNVLTLIGRRQNNLGATPLYRESAEADFRRVFELDRSIDTAKITAKIEQGILTLTLPKAEHVKPRKISVG